MEFVNLPELGVQILLRPVSFEDYRLSIRNDISELSKKGNARRPVIGVSAKEAREFAARMGGRLPKLEEMTALVMNLKSYSSIFACSSKSCLSEWLDCVPDWAMENNCIINPAWLQNRNGLCARGSIPNRRMSFVTFRFVRT